MFYTYDSGLYYLDGRTDDGRRRRVTDDGRRMTDGLRTTNVDGLDRDDGDGRRTTTTDGLRTTRRTDGVYLVVIIP